MQEGGWVGGRGVVGTQKWEVMAGASRMEEEEEAGKVGRVAFNNVAIYFGFLVCVHFVLTK